jgi:hypothetical protein
VQVWGGEGLYKGMRYQGDWEGGLKHGEGIVTMTNGHVSEGTYKNDNHVQGKRIVGKGSPLYHGSVAPGDVYVGGFTRPDKTTGNLPHGKGTLQCVNGDTYNGHWKLGKKNGQGACVAEDGCDPFFFFFFIVHARWRTEQL